MVTASNAQQRILLTLQECDNRSARIARDLGALERDSRGAVLRDQLSALSPRLIELMGAIEDVRAEIARVEADVNMVDQRLETDLARIDASSSAKDVVGLEHEVATLNARKSTLEDAELEAMEQLEQLGAALAELTTEREGISNDLAALDSVIDEERAQLVSQREATAAERGSIVATVQPDLYELYEKQRQRYGIGAALLRAGVSGGSGMALSAHDLEDIKKACLLYTSDAADE